jgi:hypothetical protein
MLSLNYRCSCYILQNEIFSQIYDVQKVSDSAHTHTHTLSLSLSLSLFLLSS